MIALGLSVPGTVRLALGWWALVTVASATESSHRSLLSASTLPCSDMLCGFPVPPVRALTCSGLLSVRPPS
jgi:hypothetical protein